MKRLLLLLSIAATYPAISMERPPAAAQNQVFDKKETLCTICQDTIKVGEHYTCLPCQHALHFECFQHLTESTHSVRCPVCRQNIGSDIVRTLQAQSSGVIEPAEAQEPSIITTISNLFKSSAKKPEAHDITAALMKYQQQLARKQQENSQLIEARQQLENNLRSQIERLIDQKKALEQQIKLAEEKFNKFKLLNPELAHVEGLKQSINVLAVEKEQLDLQNRLLTQQIERGSKTIAELQAIKSQLETKVSKSEDDLHFFDAHVPKFIEDHKQLNENHKQLKDENETLKNKTAELEKRNTKNVNALYRQRDRHDALRRRLVTIGAWTSAAIGGLFAYKYFPAHPKLASFLTGASLLLGSMYWGFSYTYKCNNLDYEDAQR